MKVFFILGSLALCGCDAPVSTGRTTDAPAISIPAEPSSQDPSATQAPVVLGRYFFDFDAVDLYHTDLGEDGVFDSTGHIPPSKQMLADVLIGSWPKDLTDISALRSMERIGYEQVKIPKERLHALAELFREKTIGGGYSKACIAEYRDVLIFRNKGKIIGVAKICFGCLQNMIVGTTANTEFFGEDGDYQRLYEILAPFRSRQSAQRA